MDGYINDIVNTALPIIGTVLTGVMTWAAAKINKFIKEKKLEGAASKAYFITDEFFRLNPGLKKSADDKLNMFAQEIRKLAPKVTDAQIETLRQAIAGEVNKDKVTAIQMYDSPIQEATAVVATVKYYAPDGTELQPVPKQE